MIVVIRELKTVKLKKGIYVYIKEEKNGYIAYNSLINVHTYGKTVNEALSNFKKELEKILKYLKDII